MNRKKDCRRLRSKMKIERSLRCFRPRSLENEERSLSKIAIVELLSCGIAVGAIKALLPRKIRDLNLNPSAC
jgi:hypothetical protein